MDYGIAETSLGLLLAAVSDKGLCAVLLGDAEAPLLAELKRRFPREALVLGGTAGNQALEMLIAMLAGRECQEVLPLDERGTLFQRRVWEELRRIPRGETISYGELAARIGRPRAPRAVAGACAQNPLAIVTPCHRVVGKNGRLGGYYWGVERKRRLLEQEGGSC